jgi:eukaryotic-like serine/threonine-protein kinase
MSLRPGTRIGPYDVVGPIGAGGMGEVFRARDTRLGRDVAIKGMPAAVAGDPERVARFQREAQVLATLNHPHIGAIYGLEVAGASRYLILEFIDGESLADRLQRGPLPRDEVVTMARQILDALEAAHDKNIIHRDLKPANVMITGDGQVKVLDFGLARIVESDPAASQANSPTLTFAATQMGVILGTAAYMSPEQAKGRIADRRSDVWAFGCVLFEMLTGRRAFDGEDVSETLAAVLRADPDWSVLPAGLPPGIRTLIQRCLTRDRKARIPEMGTVRFLLDDALSAPPASAAPVSAPVRGRDRIWMATTGIAVAAALAIAFWPEPPIPPPAPVTFAFMPPTGQVFATGPGLISMSPDGTQMAFAVNQEPDTVLWIRDLSTLEARRVPGSDGAWHVAWSPDSRSIVFVGSGGNSGLKRLDLTGGPPRTLAADATSRAAWSPLGVIVYEERASRRLMRIADTGSTPMPATELDTAAGETGHSWPAFLPDGRRFLFLARNADATKSAIYLASLDTMERTRLMDAHSMVDLVPGYLLYQQSGTLLARAFDADAGRLTGAEFPVAEDIQTNLGNGRAAFAAAGNVLAYRAGAALGRDALLTWFDRQGRRVDTIGQLGPYRRPQLSTNGSRLVVPMRPTSSNFDSDLFVVDIARGIPIRFTSGGTASAPLWTRDDSSIVFSAQPRGVLDLFIKPAGGAAPERPLLESPEEKRAESFSPSGDTLVFSVGPFGARRLWTTSMTGDPKPARLFPNSTDESEDQAAFSPDGKWIAYTASTGGVGNVFVQPFPPTGYRQQISATNGSDPDWTADMRHIAFVTNDNRIMLADVMPQGTTLGAGVPRELFQQRQVAGVTGFSMDARAERFLLVVDPAGSVDGVPSTQQPITIVVNWLNAIKR